MASGEAEAIKTRRAYRVRRTPQACNTCRRRKTKCDGTKPRCRHCSSRNVACIWDDGDKPTPVSTPSPTISTRNQVSIPPSVASRSDHSPSVPALIELPESGLAKACIRIFVERHLATDFCSFLYPAQLYSHYNESPFLAFAIVALCSRYLENDELASSPYGSPGEACAHSASIARSLAKETSDQPSVPNIQANLVLALSELLADVGSGHWMYAGTAIRMAQIMRLNKEYHQGHSLEQREVRRRTFWACLLFDRLLAFLLTKPQTLSITNIDIALPATDISLAYQEATHGLTLNHLATFSQRPSEIGLAAFFIKTVVLWSDIADIKICPGRFTDSLPPTDPNSRFARDHGAMRSWVASLPPVLQWNSQTSQIHSSMGQGRLFVAMHLLMKSALCIAHQAYLPQTDGSSVLLDIVDSAGWSLLHREPQLISTAVSAALDIGAIVTSLLDEGDEDRTALLQSAWVASSLLSAVNTLLWLKFADDITPITDPEARSRAETYFKTFLNLFDSWRAQLPAAKIWIITLKELEATYTDAYLGQADEGDFNEVEEAADAASSQWLPNGLSDQSSESQPNSGYRPKPGDGAPAVNDLSLVSLHDSLRLNVLDETTTATRLKRRRTVWLELASSCPTLLTVPDGASGFDIGM